MRKYGLICVFLTLLFVPILWVSQILAQPTLGQSNVGPIFTENDNPYPLSVTGPPKGPWQSLGSGDGTWGYSRSYENGGVSVHGGPGSEIYTYSGSYTHYRGGIANYDPYPSYAPLY